MNDRSKMTDGEAGSAAMSGGPIEAEPTREERAAAVVRDLEHAVKHNAPIPHSLIGEVRHLLGAPNPDPASSDAG